MASPARPVLRAVRRALPRVAAAALGLVLVGSDRELVGIGVLVLVVLSSPARWWRYVRTGEKATGAPAAAFCEQGSWRVELHHPGLRPIDVVKAIREVTWTGVPEAKSQVQGAPVMIATDLSESSARKVRDRVQQAGATASAVPGDVA